MYIGEFNHKGGGSKTTTTFNLGWMLACKMTLRPVCVDNSERASVELCRGYHHDLVAAAG